MAASVFQLGPVFAGNAFNPEAISLSAKLLKPLDEVLRCHICFEYFTNCMITKCSHNYCSLCIRKYMAYKSQCPTCFKAASEPELQNNRLIDEILQIYKRLRDALQISPESLDNIKCDRPCSSKQASSHDLKKHSGIDKCSSDNGGQSGDQKMLESASDDVACPVCYRTVPGWEINRHLDRCLKQSEKSPERKYLPKLVYHLLKDKQIKEKLKNHGLSTSGDRQTLIKRHKSFVLLYNANCDSLNPKPVSDLLLEIEQQEVEERILATLRTTPPSKKSHPTVIEKQNDTYAQEHKSQFTALLQDVQRRELSKIKKEEASDVFMTSSMTDSARNQVKGPSLQIGNPANFEKVTVKQEVSDSLPSTESADETSEEELEKQKTFMHKKLNKSRQSSNKPLPFQIRKKVHIKLKRDPSLLDMSDSSTDSSSSEDFAVNKMQTNACLKKNIRKLSVGDGNGNQRKK